MNHTKYQPIATQGFPAPLRSTALLAAALVTVVGAGCATNQPEPTVTADRPKAIEQYVEGYGAYKAGDTDTAVKELEGAVRQNPDLIMARTILGEIYRTRNDYDAASKHYEVLSNRDNYTLSNHYYLGVSYQFLSRYNDSASAYLRGLKLEPKDFNSNMNLGSVYLSMGDIDSAVGYMDRATQINPQSHVAWSNLGVVLDARNSAVLAETAYRKALELQPESLAIQQNLGTNLLLQKKTAEATQLWESIVQKSKTDFTQTKLAEAYTQGSELSRALEQLDEVLARDPRYVPALNAKAGVLLKQYEQNNQEDKFRAEAVALLRNSLSLNSSQPKVAELLKQHEKPASTAQ